MLYDRSLVSSRAGTAASEMTDYRMKGIFVFSPHVLTDYAAHPARFLLTGQIRKKCEANQLPTHSDCL